MTHHYFTKRYLKSLKVNVLRIQENNLRRVVECGLTFEYFYIFHLAQITIAAFIIARRVNSNYFKPYCSHRQVNDALCHHCRQAILDFIVHF